MVRKAFDERVGAEDRAQRDGDGQQHEHDETASVAAARGGAPSGGRHG